MNKEVERYISKYVGNMIKELRKRRGLTQKQLGEKIGVKHNTISSYESGTNEPEQNILFELARVLDCSIDDFFPDLKHHQVVKEQKYHYYPDAISAGIPDMVEGAIAYQSITLPDRVLGKWAGKKDIVFMNVNGESMNNIIPHGSLIGVKPIGQYDLKSGDIVVFRNGDGHSLKRLIHDKENEKVIFRPDSSDPSFYDITYHASEMNENDLNIFGKVVFYLVTLD